MANANTPFGFLPYRYKDGSDWNGMATPYYIPAADANQFNIGDAVKTAANGDANGIPAVTKITNGTDTVRGVIVGVLPVQPLTQSLQAVSLSLETQNIPATKTRDYYVLVCDDPAVVFQIVDDGLNTLTATACNKNATFTVANPSSSTTPNSATVLNTASLATTQTLNIKLMGLVQDPTNAFGQYARWVAIFNQHELGGCNTTGI